jgi:hypothetical protein
MRVNKKHLLGNLAIFLGSMIFAVVAVGFSGSASFKTADDTQILGQILLQQPSQQQVKGVISENNYCPKDKPIMGWIDFDGSKKIIQNLNQNQLPSACFSDLEEAKKEGFELE